jgi:dTDP-4-amino-4,6-dideoxygalactose transaminase
MNPTKIPYEDLESLNKPYFEDLIQISKNTIESGWYILGNNVEEFERSFAAANNSKFCLGVASGLDALILGIMAFDFPKNSKILVPSNTYIATILSIIRADLIPILVEPDPYTYNITRAGLEDMYDNECVAIMPVHLYGRICPMEEILDFATQKGLKIIEDCAQSHFAKINGINAGTFGDIGAFSFYPTKNLGALGDAGAILCKSESVYFKLKALRNYGSEKKYNFKYLGLNSRLDEIQAAFLNLKLKDYKNVILHKSKLASIYLTELKELNNIQLPIDSKDGCVWHIFNILTNKRDELATYLKTKGITTDIHYPIAPHNQEAYKELFASREYPISTKIHESTLSLPISMIHNENDILFICNCIKSFFR